MAVAEHTDGSDRRNRLDQLDDLGQRLAKRVVLAHTEDRIDRGSPTRGQAAAGCLDVALHQLDERVEQVEHDRRCAGADHVRGRGGSARGRSW